jgi:hypothetical protein
VARQLLLAHLWQRLAGWEGLLRGQQTLAPSPVPQPAPVLVADTTALAQH